MVKASTGLIPVLADCSQRSANGDLKSKYQIKGFPTVVFTDSSGKEVERLQGRDAASVKGQIDRVVDKYAAKLFVEMNVSEATQSASEGGKLLALVFFDESKAKAKKKNEQLMAVLLSDAMEEVRDKFVWIKRPLKDGKKKTEEAKGYKASKTATIIVIDPGAEEDPVLKKISSPKGLSKALKKIHEKATKSK